jgi:spore maturation protein CgeB
MRYTEILACGGFLLADKPNDFDLLGFKNNKHLVLYKGMKDLKEKVKYYMDPKNNAERQKIANQGMKFVRENHSCKVRAQEFKKIINEELGI